MKYKSQVNLSTVLDSLETLECDGKVVGREADLQLRRVTQDAFGQNFTTTKPHVLSSDNPRANLTCGLTRGGLSDVLL